MSNEIIIALIGGIATIVASVIAYVKDSRAKKQASTNSDLMMEIKNIRIAFERNQKRLADTTIKASILDRIGELTIFNEVKNSVDRIFENTRADRFIILYGMNGTHEIKSVSVAFELRKKSPSAAIIRYRDVRIDDEYRNILRNLEKHGTISFKRCNMQPGILKDFFTLEGLNSIKANFIERRKLDSHNDIVIFGIIAAVEKEEWSEHEHALINSEYEGTIKPIIRAFL